MSIGKEFFVALRGEPDGCDFCGAMLPADKLEPEEAGMWVCWDCLDRWDAQEKSK